ncbi:MAG: glycosyl hydrolase-related protein, partial [Candidatus Hodarchaeota archaeon]
SKEELELNIEVLLTLYDPEPFLRVKVVMENEAEDHRLRLLFPSFLDTNFSYAADHFMVIKRDIELPKDEGWFQPAQGLYHTDGFVDLSDDKEGLCVHVKGLPEFEILKEKNNAIAITLFRSVGWLSQGGHLGRPTGLNGPNLPTPGAQCKRKMKFDLAIQPHKGDWRGANLHKYMKAFQVPLKGVLKTSSEYFYEPMLRKENPRTLEFKEESLIRLEPKDLVVSAIKKAEDENGVIIRLYNPAGEEITGKMTLSFKPLTISIVNLNEDFLESVMNIEENEFEFGIKSNEIKTFLVIPERFKE